MIKHILWDFDGVIFDSMKIKSEGFQSLFVGYDNKILSEIEAYHYTHGGVSRFDKIRYFHEVLLEQAISDEEIIQLADKFANIIEKKLFDKNNLILDSITFIKKHYQDYNFHIVSGAEHNELNHICEVFDLKPYFISINGSPTKKDILVNKVLDAHQYKNEETILIGDAMTDYNAALKNNIGFYGYNNMSLKKFNYIETFRTFYP